MSTALKVLSGPVGRFAGRYLTTIPAPPVNTIDLPDYAPSAPTGR